MSTAKMFRREPVVHELKTWPSFFEPVALGLKPFEVRENDRDYRVGDVLDLREWDVMLGDYTGHRCRRRVTYLLSENPRFGIALGYCAMGLGPE